MKYLKNQTNYVCESKYKKKKKTDYVTEHKDRTYLTYQVTEYENTVDKIKNSDYKYDRNGKQKKYNICQIVLIVHKIIVDKIRHTVV